MADRHPPTLLLAGCGNMGSALLRGWLAAGTESPVIVLDPHPQYLAEGVYYEKHADALPPGVRADIVVLAVKPQQVADTAPALRRLSDANTVWLSIAAGMTLHALSAHLGPETAIVRAMPNTPALVGQGVSVLCGNRHVTAEQRMQCEQLLAAVGETHWIDDEQHMDAVTALSGSGPAYVFLLMEALADAGHAQGLPRDFAEALALATVRGAAALAQSSEDTFATLRERVTSPGGTTQAALDVLMRPAGMQSLLNEAIAAATKRSRELAG